MVRQLLVRQSRLSRGLGVVRGLAVVAVVSGCCVFAPQALAFRPVPGSPFATGSGAVSVAFSPDGRLVANVDYYDNQVSVFSVGAGGALSEVAGSPFTVGPVCYDGDCGAWSVAFSPDGKRLAVTSFCGDSVSVFTVGADGALSNEASYPTGACAYQVAFSPDGKLLAVANQNSNDVSVFSIETDGTLTEVPGSPFPTGTEPFSVAFSPDGGLLATTNQSGVQVFSVAADGALSEVAGSPFTTGPDFVPYSVAFSPDGGLLATANATDDTASVFSVGAGGALTQVAGSPFPTNGGEPYSVAFSPDGGLLAVANAASSTVSLLSVGSGGVLTAVVGSPFATGSPSGSDYSVAFSPAGGCSRPQTRSLSARVGTVCRCSRSAPRPRSGRRRRRSTTRLIIRRSLSVSRSRQGSRVLTRRVTCGSSRAPIPTAPRAAAARLIPRWLGRSRIR